MSTYETKGEKRGGGGQKNKKIKSPATNTVRNLGQKDEIRPQV